MAGLVGGAGSPGHLRGVQLWLHGAAGARGSRLQTRESDTETLTVALSCPGHSLAPGQFCQRASNVSQNVSMTPIDIRILPGSGHNLKGWVPLCVMT